VKGLGNQQDYGMRIYDPRVGRFLSVDPLTNHFSALSPYQYAMNTPIQATDLDGAEAKISNEDGGKVMAITGVMTVWEVRNSTTNTFLRLNPGIHDNLRDKELAKIGITDPEITKHFQLRMRTVVVKEELKFCLRCVGNEEIEKTYSREWVVEPENTLAKELLETGLDIVSIASVTTPAKGSLILLARGQGAIVVNQLKTLFHPQAFLKGFKIPLKANGAPDFSKMLAGIRSGQKNELKDFKYTGNYAQDFKKADELAGFTELNPKPANTTWHHVEDFDSKTGTGTLQLVSRDAHQAASHSGGAAQYRAANRGKGYGKN